MEQTTSQVLSLIYMVLIPFIPNDSLRYVMLVLAPFSFVVYLVYHNTPSRQVARLDASVKEINALVETAMKECKRDPRFVYETELKLIETKYNVSTLRTRAIGMKYISWNVYPYHLKGIASSIEQCRREMEDSHSSILLALELARQQKYREEIGQKMATLASNFQLDIDRAPVVDEAFSGPAVVFKVCP
ncbi:hypothetical protein B0H19DRAFT_1367136 [Mycena capillaripes]|nr:hypothetical protein B0H19DRAFT_1367136 [Mycena capillaripes]